MSAKSNVTRINPAKAAQAPPICSLADDDGYREYLARYAGREFIGIPQRTLPKLDRLTMGLRGLNLVAGGPNVGKTSMVVQLGIDSVLNNADTALLFVSIEMTRHAMRARIESRLAGIPWRDLVRGTFDEAASARLDTARCTISNIGERIRILDRENLPSPTVAAVKQQIGELRELPGIEHVVILIDYLQVWPADENAHTLRTDNDSDKWRIAQMLELRDANNDDPVIVISESRKPSSKSGGWASHMGDIMGAARTSYSPDCIMLLREWPDEALVIRAGLEVDKSGIEGAARNIRRDQAEKGFAMTRLQIVKGRDGTQRGNVDCKFHFESTEFLEDDGQ